MVMSNQKAPFWKRPEVIAAIKRLAAVDEFTIVTGAGTSAEAGFPLWTGVVSGLLSQAVAVDRRLKSDADREALVERVMAEGPIAAASYAQALLGDKLSAALINVLYEPVLSSAVPGAAAIAIARLREHWGSGVELATLNYDLQLELALSETGLSPVKPIRNARKPAGGETVVRHLHGVCPPTGPAEGIVLTEADYYDVKERTPWQTKYMTARLEQGALFVGTSLSDPNLLRYLYSQKSIQPLKHTAVMTVPPSDPGYGSSPYEDASTRKWREVGVDLLQNEMYGQTAQFLHEVRIARELGDRYVAYQDRLDLWNLGMKSWLHDFEDRRAFWNSQLWLQDRLEVILTTLRQLIQERGVHMPEQERLGLRLWSRRPESHDIIYLGSDSMHWSVPSVMPRVDIRKPGRNPAAQAFCRGTRMVFDLPADRVEPWRSILALPIALDNHPRFGRLPVGVLTVSSTEALEDSVLLKLRAEVPDADEYLVGVGGPGQVLLDPEEGTSVTQTE